MDSLNDHSPNQYLKNQMVKLTRVHSIIKTMIIQGTALAKQDIC